MPSHDPKLPLPNLTAEARGPNLADLSHSLAQQIDLTPESQMHSEMLLEGTGLLDAMLGRDYVPDQASLKTVYDLTRDGWRSTPRQPGLGRIPFLEGYVGVEGLVCVTDGHGNSAPIDPVSLASPDDWRDTGHAGRAVSMSSRL